MERYFLFGEYNTYEDWGLILTKKTTPPPNTKENYMELEGAHGSLDATEALTGEPKYKDRIVTASFFTCEGTRYKREELMRTIITALHGKKMKIVEPDDLEHYFEGRIKVIPGKSNHAYMEFSIEATCEPFRYSELERMYKVDVVQGVETTLVCMNLGIMTVVPTITIDGAAIITFEGKFVPVVNGSNPEPDVRFKKGSNILTINGTGSIKVSYREAVL